MAPSIFRTLITRHFLQNMIGLIYKMDLAPVFDYTDWKSGEEMIQQQSFEKMDAVTICKLFTVMLRTERFMEGFIAS